MHYSTITELVARHRELPSEIELSLSQVLSRIDTFNADLNAIVQNFSKEAKERASYLINNASELKELPLYGVPLTIKEAFAYQGTPSTINFPPLKNYQPQSTSILVKRLEDAGAIIVGKTNVPLLLSDCQSFGPIYPRANNPYDLTRTPGGSTGGGAAAVAAGFSYGELGSDIGGSIRNPASFCGLYGLKPTQNGHVHDGHVPPLPNRGNGFLALNSTGPLARSAADLKAMYDVCYQALPEYQQYLNVDNGLSTRTTLEGYRFAYFDQVLDIQASSATRDGLKRTIAILEAAGASVDRIEINGQLSNKIFETWVTLFGFVVGQDFNWLIRQILKFKFGQDLNRSSLDVKPALKRGLSMNFRHYSKALAAQQECMSEFQQYFNNYDFILSPTSIGPAFKHNPKHRDIEIEGTKHNYTDYCFSFVMPYNLLGNPVLCVPSGLDKSLNLPIGVSIAAPHHSEQQLLNLGMLLEKEGLRFKAPPL